MANLARVHVEWTGAAVVGPGLSTFYFGEAETGFSADLATFFTAVQNRFPVGVTWSIPSSGDLIDIATGELSGTWSGETGSVVNATGANGYVQGAGGSIEWQTAGIRGGRRVLGRTFLCPLDNGVWSGGGVMNATANSALNSALGTFLGAGNDQYIYSRPTVANGAGIASLVTSATIPTSVSWLRSRRT